MSEIKVHLRANNGQYVCAEGGGLGPVVANRDRPLEWETFVLGDANDGSLNSGDSVTFRSVNGWYFCAENGGGREVNATRILAQAWETFRIQHADGSDGEITDGQQVALRANDEHWVSAEDGGGREVVANRDAIGPWETFTIEFFEYFPPEPDIRFEFNWAGAVVILSHAMTQRLLDTTSDAVAVLNALTAAVAGAGLAMNPIISAAVGVIAAYINAQREIIRVMDRGDGVYLTLPYPVILYGQWWLIIATPRY